MNYWLDLFTGTTWREFKDAGAAVSGFRASKRNVGRRIGKGDIFLCYLTGVMRWVGALEVVGPSDDTTRIWQDDPFPVRFDVKPLVLLEPEHGVPMEQMKGHVTFFASAKDSGKFRGLVRGSPNLIQNSKDGEFILALLKQAQQNPVSRPVDPKKLARKPLYKIEPKRGSTRTPTLVSVPEPEEPAASQPERVDMVESATTRHTDVCFVSFDRTLVLNNGSPLRSFNLLGDCILRQQRLVALKIKPGHSAGPPDLY